MITDIRTDALQASTSIQQRASGLDERTVAGYITDAADGWPYPPILVFRDPDGLLWVADGFHRVEAALRLDVQQIPTEVREGTARDATLYACGANATHGLPRTNADKRKAVKTLLSDSEWSQWSDREIARTACVSNNLVSTVRAELSSDDSCAAKRQCADGRTRNTSGIRKANRERAKSVPPSTQKTTETHNAPLAKEAVAKPEQPTVPAPQVVDQIVGACTNLRAAELAERDLVKVAAYVRDTFIWLLPKLPEQDADAMRQKVANAAIKVATDAA